VGAGRGDFCAEQHLLLDLVVEDQTVGLKRMRAGEVAACLCASERPVAGARSVLLGAMRYRAWPVRPSSRGISPGRARRSVGPHAGAGVWPG
jgi:LysR family transcriptional regulator (chromosome initiation inhibitor)